MILSNFLCVGRWLWTSESPQECIITYLRNELAVKMDTHLNVLPINSVAKVEMMESIEALIS